NPARSTPSGRYSRKRGNTATRTSRYSPLTHWRASRRRPATTRERAPCAKPPTTGSPPRRTSLRNGTGSTLVEQDEREQSPGHDRNADQLTPHQFLTQEEE